ncbi:MAG: hypothetical protein JW820_08330 [Spirochaetales bacterium]|nr:hypothetical protein [Spirochaetales bacterium]
MVSHSSLWELALKTVAGKAVFSPPLRRWLAEQQGIWHFSYLSVTEEHILRTLEVQRHHQDPFDRLSWWLRRWSGTCPSLPRTLRSESTLSR